GQLQGEAQPVLVPATLGDQGTVGVVEVEVPRQLGGRGLAGVAAVAPLLLRGQEVDGHWGSFRRGLRKEGGAPAWNRRTSCDKKHYHRNRRPGPRRHRGIPDRWAERGSIVITGITPRES